MRKVAIYTLGCKLNQAESSMLVEEFSRRGYRVVSFGHPADVVVINTCSVTQRTDACSRQAIRRAAREWPRAFLAVVGCYAQLAPQELAAIPGVDVVLGADAKFRLFDYLDGAEKKARPEIVTAHCQVQCVAPCPGNPSPRTRAFLKVQDGCDAGCSYCTVPLARGPSRSAPPEDVLARAVELYRRGHKELVLTGVHVGTYGRDLRPSSDLATLLERLCAELPGVRFRLSSLECTEITPRLLHVVATRPQVCRHFHVPLQSGSDAILASMRRPYTAREFLQCVTNIRATFPEASIGTDVIVGYPGETEKDFQATLELLESGDFAYLHVFRYSRRPHTPAAELADDVPALVKEERSALLRGLGTKKRMSFASRFIGKSLQVLFEREANGWALGTSDNYLKVRVPKAEFPVRNLLATVHIQGMSEDGALLGRLVTSAQDEGAVRTQERPVEVPTACGCGVTT